MYDPSEFYRTDSIALVAYLKLNEHTPQDLRWEGSTCHWYFRISDKLTELVDTFFEGRALVEPRVFDRKFQEVKRDFWDSNPHPRNNRR